MTITTLIVKLLLITSAIATMVAASSTVQTQDISEPRKKQNGGMMMSIMPMLITPFLVSTGMIPMMLISLKLMLAKSIFIGKLAVLLILINMFRGRNSGQGGVINHTLQERDKKVSMAHYGYGGDEEYGAYVNKRSSR